MVIRFLFLFFIVSPSLRAFEEDLLRKVRSIENADIQTAMVVGERVGSFVAPGLGIFPYAFYSAFSKTKKHEEVLSMWRDAAEAMVLSTGVTWITKSAVGRARPYMNKGAWGFSPFTGSSDYFAFPSGHTSVSWSVLSVLSHYSSDWVGPVFFYSLATLAGVSRIYDNKHWATDVVAGALIGYYSAQWAVNNEKKFGMFAELYPVVGAQKVGFLARF